MLWEAQFGDFINGAQVIVDQFLSAGLSKWGLTTRLTLLLPHGYEGQGPEHSSARLERFLQLAAEGNIRVANPTTPAQYFHLLRRQARRTRQRPLVVMTPKSLLRLPQAGSRLEDLAEGRWHPVLDDPWAASHAEDITRVVLCTGKVYYDLLAEAEKLTERRPGDRAAGAALLVPVGGGASVLARYPRLERAGLGAGGAAQHGGLELPGARSWPSSRPRASRWATSVARSGRAPPRDTRRPTPRSRAGSSARRWRPAGAQRRRRPPRSESRRAEPRSDHGVEQPQRPVGHGAEGQVTCEPAGVGRHGKARGARPRPSAGTTPFVDRRPEHRPEPDTRRAADSGQPTPEHRVHRARADRRAPNGRRTRERSRSLPSSVRPMAPAAFSTAAP